MPRRNKDAKVQIVWFKRDLRAVDHQPLLQAARHGPILPLLIIEREWWQQPDMSGRQYAFYRECVAELGASLAALGQLLIVRVGDAVACLSEFHREMPVAGLWSHEETGGDWTFQRDLRVADWCRQNGVLWTELRQDGVIRRLKSRNGWAGKWDKLMAEPVAAAPEQLTLPQRAPVTDRLPSARELGLQYDNPADRQIGGRSYALSTLDSFLNIRGESYRKSMSSPISGEQACSRLSPYLAWGAVSMREVAQATWQRQRQLKQTGGKQVNAWRSSLVSFNGRLHWHCHFMQKLEDEPRLEFANLHPSYDGLRLPSETDPARLSAWQSGETGWPFVDACMRFLAATGWLNFRMRAMLMATASYHLWLDWRAPGLHLARQFTDFEPGIHWPQVQMQSGTTGINTVRIYNPIKQGYDQDPHGNFVRRWVPELSPISGAAIHEPWKSELAGQLLDKVYPMPIVDHMEAAREARHKIYAARKGSDFRETADAIQSKHGSRKTGMPNRGKRRGVKGKRAPSGIENGQLSMSLEPIEQQGSEVGN